DPFGDLLREVTRRRDRLKQAARDVGRIHFAIAQFIGSSYDPTTQPGWGPIATGSPQVILMLINVMLLVLGCFMDMAPSILIATPILLPVMMNFGVDPVHFGMIMMLNFGIGLCHPPVGSILFVGCAVGKVSIEQVMRRIWPFYAVMFTVLMFVTYVPWLSLWLPSLVLK